MLPNIKTSNCNNFSDDFYNVDGNCKGIICLFSLKNPSYPEYICLAHCGISAIDIHPTHPHMLVAGLMDGNVAVYDLQKRSQSHSYLSSAKQGKHQEVVWQVGAHSSVS